MIAVTAKGHDDRSDSVLVSFDLKWEESFLEKKYLLYLEREFR
jgi:hypothetical protein